MGPRSARAAQSRIGRGAAVLAVVAIVVGARRRSPYSPTCGAVPPAGEVRGGALPSRIDVTNGDFEEDWRASGHGRSVACPAATASCSSVPRTGRYHHFAASWRTVLALSPDGYRVAWWSTTGSTPTRIAIADLRTGEVTEFAHNQGARRGRSPRCPGDTDSTQLRWNGSDDEGARSRRGIDVHRPVGEQSTRRGATAHAASPPRSSDIIALPSDGEVAAAPFEQVPERGSGRTTGIPLDRAAPADLYPDGAVVTPVGWADEDHVVAIIDPPPSDVVERPRLAVFTSPDRPEAEWTFREFLPRLPPEAHRASPST